MVITVRSFVEGRVQVFNTRLLLTLLTVVYVFFWKTLMGSLFNAINRVQVEQSNSHSVKFLIITRHWYQHKEKIIDD